MNIRHSPLIEEFNYSSAVPKYSIVMPIHNQESIIQTVLEKIVLNTVGIYEIILILDGCRDRSSEIVHKFFATSPSNNLCRCAIITNKNGVFETSSDNQGFMSSRGEYIVEIQADMMMLTYGYNALLCVPMEIWDDILAISGRGAHTWPFDLTGVGKINELVKLPHKTLQDYSNYDKVFLSHTIFRGPMAFKRRMLEEMGFLDEDHFVLGNDDHDLFARAWHFKKWRCGFFPVEFLSRFEWGSQRKEQPSDVKEYLRSRKLNECGGFINTTNITSPSVETRTMENSKMINAMKALT